MTSSDDIKELRETLREVFSLIRSYQKDFSESKAKLESHLESSKIRVSNYDSDIEELKNKIITISNKVQIVHDFMVGHENQAKGIKGIREKLAWLEYCWGRSCYLPGVQKMRIAIIDDDPGQLQVFSDVIYSALKGVSVDFYDDATKFAQTDDGQYKVVIVDHRFNNGKEWKDVYNGLKNNPQVIVTMTYPP